MADMCIEYASEYYRDDVGALIDDIQREEFGVDISSAEDLLWSITKQVDAADDMFSIPQSKGHPIDPTARRTSDSLRDPEFTKWSVDRPSRRFSIPTKVPVASERSRRATAR